MVPLALPVSHPLFHFFWNIPFFFLSLICNVIINIVVFYSICETYNRIVSIQFLTLPLFRFFFFFLFFFCLFKNDNIIQLGDKLSHPFFAYRYIVGFLIFNPYIHLTNYLKDIPTIGFPLTNLIDCLHILLVWYWRFIKCHVRRIFTNYGKQNHL